jgi:hypothetical protein
MNFWYKSFTHVSVTSEKVRAYQTEWFGTFNRPMTLIGLIPEDIP